MKTLIIYYSFSGNNALLVQNISNRLGADVLQITEPSKRTPFKILLDMIFNRTPPINPLSVTWEDYEHIILASPIWNYSISYPMKSFIKMAKKHLNDYSFITLCHGRKGQKEKITAQLKRWTGKEPRVVAQLMITRLLATENPKNLIGYQVKKEDMHFFKQEIEQFIQAVSLLIHI